MNKSIVAAGVGAVLMVSACAADGGDTDSDTSVDTAGDTSEELTPVSVGVLPLVDVAPLYLAAERGIFADHGLDLEISVMQGGPATVAAVVSQEVQFGFASPPAVITAHLRGLPLIAVTNGISQGEGLTQAVVAPKDGVVSAPEDLEGANVGVIAVESVSEMGTRAAAEALGVDPDLISFLAMPYPDMIASLEAGRIDAAYLAEPFLSASLEDTNVIIENPLTLAIGADASFSVYFTSTDLIDSDPELVDRFVAANNDALEYAQAHPDEVRAAIPTYTEISPEVAQNLVLGDFTVGVNRNTFEVESRLMQDYGWIDEAPDLGAIIY